MPGESSTKDRVVDAQQLHPLGVAELDGPFGRRLDVAEHDRQRAGVGVEAGVVAVVLGRRRGHHVDRAGPQAPRRFRTLRALPTDLGCSGVERELDRAVAELHDLASHQHVRAVEGVAVDGRAVRRAEILDDHPAALGSQLEVATGDLRVVEQQPVALSPDLQDIPNDEVERRASRLPDDHRRFHHLEHFRTVAGPGRRSITAGRRSNSRAGGGVRGVAVEVEP